MIVFPHTTEAVIPLSGAATESDRANPAFHHATNSDAD